MVHVFSVNFLLAFAVQMCVCIHSAFDSERGAMTVGAALTQAPKRTEKQRRGRASLPRARPLLVKRRGRGVEIMTVSAYIVSATMHAPLTGWATYSLWILNLTHCSVHNFFKICVQQRKKQIRLKLQFHRYSSCNKKKAQVSVAVAIRAGTELVLSKLSNFMCEAGCAKC